MTALGSRRAASPVRLGLRENLTQFCLLAVVNAFVGAMVGMERSILPAIAEHDFHLAARTAVLSFIVVFGVTLGRDVAIDPRNAFAGSGIHG